MRHDYATISEDELREKAAGGALHGLYYVDHDAYHANPPQASSTFIKNCLRSPAHALHIAAHHKDTAAKDLGTAIHMALMEPHRFGKTYGREPRWEHKGNVKAGIKERADWRSEYDNRANPPPLILTADEYDTVTGILGAAMRSRSFRTLMDGAVCELGCYWQDPVSGIHCKSKFDAWQGDIVVDIKSTLDASEDAFRRQILEYDYHISAAHYCDGAKAMTGDDQAFVWIVVEKKPPYGIMCWFATPETLAAGRTLRDRGLKAYNEHLLNEAPGRVYADTITDMHLPSWYLKRIAE